MTDRMDSIEILQQNSKRRRLRGRIAAAVTAVAVLAACFVPVLAEIEWPAKIDRFERYDPVYTEYVETGTALEDLDLPEYLRAVISLGELDLDASTFVQAQPEADTSDGYTHYDYYYYGYVAPADADALYESGELAVYTIYYAAQDGSGTVGETAYRVYGSINGSANVWFACDENGEITDVILDVPVTWSGDYDPDTPGEYTFTAEFEDYTYWGSNPTAVITVYDSTETDDEEEEETAVACTCGLGTEEYSADHDTDCPYYCYEEEEEILCTCDVQTNDMGADHASGCPMYIAELAECHCGTDGEAIAENNYPWQHNADCAYFSPVECMCREQVEVTYEEDMDGETYISTTVVPGDFTHVHDAANTDCPLYGKSTVTVEKQDETTLSARLMGGTASVMSVEDAQEILAYQEETGSAMYSALGLISVVEGSEQYVASTLSANGGGSNDIAMDNYIESVAPTSGNSDYESDYFSNTTFSGLWRDYVNTIWMNKAFNEFEWTADADTDAWEGWVWSGATANSNSGTVTSNALKIPSRSTSGVWEVYSGEQLRYALENFTTGDTIRLMANINLNGDEYNWSCINANPKGITLEGNNFAIYNIGIYATGSDYAAFLIGCYQGVTIQNIQFVTAKVVNAGSVQSTSLFNFTIGSSSSNYYEVKLTNTHIVDSMFFSLSSLVSPFGRLSSGSSNSSTTYYRLTPVVSNCSVTGGFVYGNNHVAGFALGLGASQFVNASSGINTDRWGSCSYSYVSDILICGIGGHSAAFTSCSGEGFVIENCFASAEQYGTIRISGFIGGNWANVKNCFATGKLEGYSELGGFTFTYGNSGSNLTSSDTRTIENCYTTVLVGLRSNPEKQGGFSTYPSGSNGDTYINCYAAGEVANFDVDMDNPENNGGFMDRTSPTVAQRSVYNNCYYDKQTTAMREWVSGDSQSVDGVTGVLTTQLTSADFDGFTDMDDWVIDSEEQHYPQLAVFANATADDWGSEETAYLVQAYSLASTSTVFLNEWNEGYTWDDYGVRTEEEEDWTAADSAYLLTYDTVREIVSDFTVTTAGGDTVAWSEQIEGGAFTKVNSSGDTLTCTCSVGKNEYSGEHDTSCFYYAVQETVSVDSDTGVGTVDNPGMNWYDIEVTVNGQTGSRPIRLIAFMGIEAGENKTVVSGDTYDHRDDVALTMVDTLTEDLVVGLDDNEIWSSSVQMDWPVTASSDQKTGYYNVTTEATSHYASRGMVLNTAIYRAELDSGSVAVYDTPGTDGDYYYDSDLGGYIKADVSVDVTGENSSENNLSSQKWRGEIPLYSESSNARKYVITYYWILQDGRYVTDYKIITVEPGDYSLDMNVYNLSDNTANSSQVALSAAADDASGSTAYSFTYSNGSLVTASAESLPYNEETGANTVPYTTNVTAAWKNTAGTLVKQLQIQFYYRDGTLAGEATVTGDILEGQEITVPTLLYYEITNEDGQLETRSQTVDVTYTVEQDEDGAYYLRFNKLANAPDDEWADAFSAGDDSTGVTAAGAESLEAYINDLQFNTVVNLWVTIDYELPNVGGTGSIPYIIYIIGGAALLVLAVMGSIMLRRRKREKGVSGV